MPIRKGEDWGGPITGRPDFTFEGDDAVLAEKVSAHPGARFQLRSFGSDIAQAVGLGSGVGPPPMPTTELAMDALLRDEGGFVVNMAVLGTPPARLSRWSRSPTFTISVDGTQWFRGRATTVVVANGQFFHGADLVPKGHPGDGRAEIQVWSVAPGERSAAADRLKSGSHLPHPAIKERTGRHFEVRVDRKVPIDADGQRGQTDHVDLEIVPSAYRLLV